MGFLKNQGLSKLFLRILLLSKFLEGFQKMIDDNLDDQACDNLIDQISETVKECEDYFRGDS